MPKLGPTAKERQEGGDETRWSEPSTVEILREHKALEQWLERKVRGFLKKSGFDIADSDIFENSQELNDGNLTSPKSARFENADFVGGFRLVIQRTRIKREVDGRCENPTSANKSQSPLTLQWENPDTFHRVAAVLNLPRPYIPALYHSSGHVETCRNVKSGQKRECIGFIAQNTDYNWDPWSLALSYDPATNITTGLLCAEEKKGIDVKAIIDELTAKNSPSTHSALLPVIMFERLLQSSVTHYAHLHKRMCILENELELAECNGNTTNDEGQKARDWSRRLNTLKKQQASRDGRHQFWRQFHSELLQFMNRIAQETMSRRLDLEHSELEERIMSVSLKFASSESRDINSNRRIDAQLKLLYNIIQQNEARSQFHIAAAMSKDSSEVAFLTWLGALFLPPSVVASFLGIQSITVNTDPQITRWFFACSLPLIAAVLFIPFVKLLRRIWVERRCANLVAFGGKSKDIHTSNPVK